ncbi:MAG: HNH endonuclease [Brachybacterium sp.]|uniref:HNH endonuclease signature motif containing protein n=1 Tax=Brachybacterium sp. TaxID=1891286 RepID=UPI00264959D3|nr:HNH endonuclease signature motif containing protein [Brachybacterium sp.]MDN5686727.1 HNH endonuclease [Brachybacterium sp.]
MHWGHDPDHQPVGDDDDSHPDHPERPGTPELSERRDAPGPSEPDPPGPHDPPGPPDPPAPLTRPEAESLGQSIQQQAAAIAAATCEFLLMISDFEARDGVGWFVGLKSTAHWLAWACSMSPGAAREHVRVARALRSMPQTVAEFRAGCLSYSKVREITRVADRVDEAVLVDFARSMTASQLALTISSFRAVDGSRLGQDAVRQARWQVRDDGMVEIRAVLPAEMGAEVVTALDLALTRDGNDPAAADPAAADPEVVEPAVVEPATAPDSPDGAADGGRPAATDGTDTTGGTPHEDGATEPAETDPATVRAAEITTMPSLEQRRADALLSLARTFLDAEPDDRSGEDRHLVVVEVSAETLPRDVPAGTPPQSMAAPTSPDVPARTSQRCGVLGMGPLEARTAERLACTGKVAVTITDAGGEILHLGRSRRLATRGQRRALRLRDTVCSFPGCHQSRHLDAHHIVPWSEGGPTDIEGLALLCRRHHVMVHEGGLHLALDTGFAAPHHRRFQVLDADGHPVQARWPAMLEHLALRPDTGEDGATGPMGSSHVQQASEQHPGARADPERIASTTGGAGFRLADCVDALCQNAVELAA